jgi:hypothetical protein
MGGVTDGSLWKNRDFRLVLGGALINNIGDWLLILALPIFVFTESVPDETPRRYCLSS